MQESDTRTGIVWIFANHFQWSHALPSDHTGEPRKPLLSLVCFPRMGFLSWKPRSPLQRTSVRVDCLLADVLAAPSLSSLHDGPSFETTAWPRGDDRCYTRSVFPNVFTLSSLQLPVIVQHLCWKSQERDKKEASFSPWEEEMDVTLQKSQRHSALRWQHSPSPNPHSRPGSASALALGQQSPVLPGFYLEALKGH